MKNRLIQYLAGLALLLLIGASAAGMYEVRAAEASAVTISGIDYESLRMKVFKNGNNIIYYSIDNKTTWNELEGVADIDPSKGAFYWVDISWASPAANVTMYLKGDVGNGRTVINVVFPKQNTDFKVKFDKLNSDFDFTGEEDKQFFYYRKATDYNWIKVYFPNSVVPSVPDGLSYQDFLSEVQKLRFKGTKLIFKLGQEVENTSATDAGERPSKEVKVTVAKFAAAPSIKVNVTKLILNTRPTMEYSYDLETWSPCTKNMKVEDVTAVRGDTMVFFRNAATQKKAASQICTVVIPEQAGAPDSKSAVSTSCDGTKFKFSFPTASAGNPIEYCVIKPDKDFDETKASWKTIKDSSKIITLSEKTAPAGTDIYFRYKGTAANPSKGIELRLPSEYNCITVAY